MSTAFQRPLVDPAIAPAGPPRLLAVVWGLLLVNTLGFNNSSTIIPMTHSVAQVVTMGALGVAFVLALVLNPTVRLLPNTYLLLLTALVLLAIVSSLRLESGVGSLVRCARFTMFVATLWLTSCWWRDGMTLVRHHLKALSLILLSVLLGLIISPGAAFSGPDGRLVGAIWPIPAPQVGLYAANAIGLSVVLWFSRRLDGRSTLLVTIPSVVLLLLSHTRTALLGLALGLVASGASAMITTGRARRLLGGGLVVSVLAATLFGAAIQTWLARGQDAEQLTSFTGRAKVWDLLLDQPRTLAEELLGIGLTDKSFAGLPIDNNWLATYNDLGVIGVGIVAAFLFFLLCAAALRPPGTGRNCAVFIIVYCVSASYTEVGLGDASPYLLSLAVAAALLVQPARTVQAAVR